MSGIECKLFGQPVESLVTVAAEARRPAELGDGSLPLKPSSVSVDVASGMDKVIPPHLLSLIGTYISCLN